MDIMVIGASVRAAAGSLLRAGCRPVALDLFADADLAAGADATRLDPATYPACIADAVAARPPMPWIYTGAIENHPNLVARLANRAPLLGTGPAALRAVRDPVRLAEALREAWWHQTPAVATDPARVPTDGSWLVKPVRSGGGEGVAPWLGGPIPAGGPVIFQERVRGRSFAALYLAAPDGIDLIGVTRQYHGRPGNPFAYRGSLGPYRLPRPVAMEVAQLGRVVGAAFDLRGLFGIDLIIEGCRAWLIEVNPRYTASAEVLEQGLRRPLLADHLRACGVEPPAAPALRPSSRYVARQVVFARYPGSLAGRVAPPPDLGAFPEVADIPLLGTRFEVGQPVLTVFGRGATARGCRLDLARRVRNWEARLRPG